MLRCYSNILLRVRRVTQTNAGKYTPGVDKLVVKTPAARGRLVDQLTTLRSWRAQPVRRVYIPKHSDPSKLRPLGIPIPSGGNARSLLRRLQGSATRGRPIDFLGLPPLPGRAMASEAIEGDEWDAYVTLDTFSTDGTWDRLRDASPTATESP